MPNKKNDISQDEINELIKNVIQSKNNTSEKVNTPSIEEDEICKSILNSLDNKDTAKEFDEDFIDSNCYRKINVIDFMHPSTLSFQQIEKLKKIFYKIAEYFEKDFFKITNKQILCELDLNETKPDSIYWFKRKLNTPNYIREILIGNEQVILQIDPIIINKVLLDRENNTDITMISKRIANQYIFNLLKDYLRNISMSEVTEQDFSNTIYTTTSQFTQPDNIIENPRYILNAYSENNSTFKIALKCRYENIIGHIRIELSDQACLKLLAESRLIYFPGICNNNYYDNVNTYVSMGFTTLSDEQIANIKEGDLLIFNKYLGEPLDFIYNGKKIANSEGVLIDYNNGIRITEILDNKDRFSYPPDKNNSFILFGTKNLTPKDLENMGEGTIAELTSMIGELFPLVCNNMIVAFGSIEETDFLFSLKIIGVLKEPIPFINMEWGKTE